MVKHWTNFQASLESQAVNIQEISYLQERPFSAIAN